MAASKLLSAKRPLLIPLEDSLVRKVLRVSRREVWAAIYWAVRDEQINERLMALRDEVSVGPSLPLPASSTFWLGKWAEGVELKVPLSTSGSDYFENWSGFVPTACPHERETARNTVTSGAPLVGYSWLVEQVFSLFVELIQPNAFSQHSI